MPSEPPRPDSPTRLHWTAWSALLFTALSRAVIPFEPFPYWDMDPATVYVPSTGLGPTASLALDALALLACALALFAEARAQRPILKLPCALAAIGAIPVCIHAVRGPGLSIDDARLGFDWLAAIALGLAFTHLARTPRLARLTFIMLAGFIALLAAKGAAQVFVEHPATVADYNANRDAILASHGWEPGSPMALGFERRLNQAEATGWFGLSNVYASFAAAGAIILIALTASAWRAVRAKKLPDGVAGIITLGLLAALGAVVMACSKAGYVALALGIALLALATFVRARSLSPTAPAIPLRPDTSGEGVARLAEPVFADSRFAIRDSRSARLGPILAISILAAALLAVAARGLIGESLGERSILFRSFYIRGALGIFAAEPLLGVGPAGFKDAYQIAKPAIAPESVDSPHSILFDFAATLGIGGLAWCILFLLWTARAGGALLHPRPEGDPAPSRDFLRPAVYTILAVTIAGAWLPTLLVAWMEHAPPGHWLNIPIATPDWALVLVLGAAAWFAVSFATAATLAAGAPWRPAAAAAALALAAHAQIEMTPIQPGSCALFMLFIALAAAPAIQARSTPRAATRIAALVPAAAALGVIALVVRVAPWESGLARAALAFRPVSDLRPQLALIESTGILPPDDPTVETLAALLGAPRATTPSQLAAQYRQLTLGAIDAAARALPTSPPHEITMQVQSRLQLLRAALLHQADPGTPARATEAERLAEHSAELFPESSAAWAWLGAVRGARADLETDPDHLTRAIQAWERAAALDPHGLPLRIRLYEACAKLGRTDDARRWARAALQIDENLRLDPLLRLTDKQMAHAQALARDP